jgi:aspartate/methionine/tyrosine aminotransferase
VTVLPPFALERFFARYEFAVRHVLGASDVEPMSLSELLALATADDRDAWDELRLGYTESAGHPALRTEIARLSGDLQPDDVLAFSGAEEGIFLAMHALLAPGDDAIVVVPAYQSLHEVARSVGARVITIPLDSRDWSLDPQRVIDAITPRTRTVVINFPHSPTGAQLPRASLDALVARCERDGITLFSDEVYRLLEHDPAGRLPVVATLGERSASLGVLSKAFGLAGLRVGWIITRDRALRERLASLRDYTTICGSAPSELLGIIALRAADRVVARAREIVAGNLEALRAFCEQRPDRIRWVPPRAGSVAFPELVGMDATEFVDRAVRETGVLAVPGELFGDGYRSHIRVGYGRRDMVEALERLEDGGLL